MLYNILIMSDFRKQRELSKNIKWIIQKEFHLIEKKKKKTMKKESKSKQELKYTRSI